MCFLTVFTSVEQCVPLLTVETSYKTLSPIKLPNECIVKKLQVIQTLKTHGTKQLCRDSYLTLVTMIKLNSYFDLLEHLQLNEKSLIVAMWKHTV